MTISTGGDPDLAQITNNSAPVELDNIITVPIDFLDKAPLQIEWSDNLKARADTYYQAVFTNTSKAGSKYYIFISSGKIEDFRKRDIAVGASGKLTVKVTPDFHYGQKNKTGENRFLVYHETDRRVIRQGRYVHSAWLKYGNMAQGFIDNLQGGNDSAIVKEFFIRLLGDPLRTFDGR